MRTDNVFKTVVRVSGESMIGYERYQKVLLEYAMFEDTSTGVSVSGMHQFGKSSLMDVICNAVEKQTEKYISVTVNLAELCSAPEDLMFRMIKNVTDTLKRSIRRRGINDPFIQEDIEDICSRQSDSQEFRGYFKQLFEDLGQHVHIVFVIDEFDSAVGFSMADDELLRTLMTTPKYNVSLFMVSRRQLQYIVNDNRCNSTLPANTNNVYIAGFNQEDRNKFFDIFPRLYQTELTEKEKKTIEFYAGNSPCIYSHIGHALVREILDGRKPDVEAICLQKSRDFRTYYEVVMQRLESDGIAGDLYSVVIGPTVGISAQQVDALEMSGYLTRDSDTYYSFSPYFVLMLGENKMDVSEGERVLEVDRRIKRIVEEQLNRFGIAAADKQKYEYFLQKKYQQEGKIYNPETYDRFISTTRRRYNTECTLLDVMSLGNTIDSFVEPLWEECFAQYFGNAPYRDWKPLFQKCCMARDPLMHGHREFLSKQDCTIVAGYCDKILTMLATETANADKTSQPHCPAWLSAMLSEQNTVPGETTAERTHEEREFAVMTYTGALYKTGKICGVFGYLDEPDNKGLLHVNEMRDLRPSQEELNIFTQVLGHVQQITVEVLEKTNKGLKFGLKNVTPSFNDLIEDSTCS